EDREILAEDVDQPALDGAVAGDDAVAQDLLVLEAEARRAVRDEAVQLDEAALVQQQVEPLARGELAARVLGREAFGPAAQLGLAWRRLELLQLGAERHVRSRAGARAGAGGPPAPARRSSRGGSAPRPRCARGTGGESRRRPGSRGCRSRHAGRPGPRHGARARPAPGGRGRAPGAGAGPRRTPARAARCSACGGTWTRSAA